MGTLSAGRHSQPVPWGLRALELTFPLGKGQGCHWVGHCTQHTELARSPPVHDREGWQEALLPPPGVLRDVRWPSQARSLCLLPACVGPGANAAVSLTARSRQGTCSVPATKGFRREEPTRKSKNRERCPEQPPGQPRSRHGQGRPQQERQHCWRHPDGRPVSTDSSHTAGTVARQPLQAPAQPKRWSP